MLSGGICCGVDIKGVCGLMNQTAPSACPAIPERATGSWTSVNPQKERANTELTFPLQEDPEVQVKLLAGGSALAGYPKRAEPEQPSHVEGNWEVGPGVRQPSSDFEWGEEL